MRTYCLLFALTCSLHAGSIRGTIFDAETGRPLAHTNVRVQPAQGGSGGTLTARTSSAGNFNFTGLARGSYIVSASRVGFVEYEYGQRRWNGAGTPVSVEQSGVTDITIQLPRYGAITGQVYDENSVGLPGQEVLAYTVAQPRQIAGHAISDDRGVYRISGLKPGRYLVRTKGGSFEDAFYIPTFFRETTVAEQASQVSVDLNMQAEYTDVRPSPGRLFRLSGRLYNAGSRSVTVTLASDMGRSIVQTTSSFDFGALPPGRYEIYATALADRTSQPMGAYTSLDLERDMNVTLSLALARLGLVVQTADGEPIAPRTTLELRARRKDLAGTQPVERFELPLLPGNPQIPVVLSAGRWELSLTPPAGYYVSGFSPDANAGSSNRPDDWNEVLITGTRMATFTISSHAGTLHGRVMDGQDPAVGAPVFLEPYDSQNYRRAGDPGMTRTDAQGRYGLAGLPPGEYRILSTREFRTPEVDLMDAARAPTIRIEPDKDNVVDLSLYSSGQ